MSVERQTDTRKTHACDMEFEEVIRKSQRPRCSARCRDGHSCRAPVVWDKTRSRPVNGRCRMHGGLSTGPKTSEGKRRALLNLKQFRSKDFGR